jgi:hypothetical protein
MDQAPTYPTHYPTVDFTAGQFAARANDPCKPPVSLDDAERHAWYAGYMSVALHELTRDLVDLRQRNLLNAYNHGMNATLQPQRPTPPPHYHPPEISAWWRGVTDSLLLECILHT